MSAPYAGLFFDPLAPATSAGPAGPAKANGPAGPAKANGPASAPAPAPVSAAAGLPAYSGSCASASLAAVPSGNPDAQHQLRKRRLQESKAAALLEVQKDLERLSRGRAAG